MAKTRKVTLSSKANLLRLSLILTPSLLTQMIINQLLVELTAKTMTKVCRTRDRIGVLTLKTLIEGNKP